MMPDPVRAGLEIDAADVLSGSLPVDAGSAVSIYHDGRRWAGVPVAAGEHADLSFSCQLPPVADPCDAEVEVRSTDGECCFAARVVRRTPRTNAHGLRAIDVYALNHPPLNSLPYVNFDGLRLRIGGGHLPPRGDPSSLAVHFGKGVRYTFEYPLRSPGWEDYYWYWPNAATSQLALTIDLRASTFESDPFHFAFVETRNGRSQKLSDVWLPSDLHSYLSFTADVEKFDRVQRDNDADGIVLPGYTQSRYLESQFARFGILPKATTKLLDWGCGIGRLAAHFIRRWPETLVHGTDIDAANVQWCQANLRAGRFTVAPLWPPTGYADATFDAAFGVSVMTHLTAEAQAAWLAELARILRPGAVALLTFAGSTGTAAGSRGRSDVWWADFSARGFDAEVRDPALDGYISDPDYYRQTNQTTENVRSCWSQYFDVLETIEAAFGNQDLAVLRRRPAT